MVLAVLTQFVLDGVQNAVRVAQHAWRGGAHLDVILPHRLPVEHRVERCHLVHSHWRDV